MAEVRFTYTQEEYKEKFLRNPVWAYKHCKIQLIETQNKKTWIVLRRINSKKSDVMKFKHTVNHAGDIVKR